VIYPKNFKLLGSKPRVTGGLFVKGEPQGLILHYDAGGSGADSAKLLHTSPKVSCHFVVDRDAKVFQCADTKYICWHCGQSKWKGLNGCNSHTIGIEFANYGWYSKKREADGEVPGIEPFTFKGRHKNPTVKYDLWEPYPAIQIEAGLELAGWAIENHPIEWVAGHDDISPGRKQDPGAAFAQHMPRFQGLLK
jgi:N-acetylmuramoyl-L-alanine amidase